MAALLLDITSFLVDNQLAAGDGIDTFRDFVPAQPNDIIMLGEYSGDPPHPVDDAVHRSVQIACRSTDPDIAHTKAQSIFNLLRAKQSDTLYVQFTVDRWGQVYLRQLPFKVKIDENDRTYYAFNIGITTTAE